ncbi:MAG: hypothetical protein IPL32_06200 [Chloracidobacterium sp.]|nr:hypothetical protein [Chloracidobacterium sp.]
MKKLRFILPLIVLALFVTGVDAQKKSTKKNTAKKPTAAKTIPPLDVRTAREKVSNQLDNMNRFIDVLGPVAQDIETLDASAKTKRLSKATLDQNEASKQKVVTAIRNFKEGLADLETEFRTKTTLKKYLPSIEGISDLMAESEDLAIAGKFVGSKDPLRQTAKKLSDTLAVMPR